MTIQIKKTFTAYLKDGVSADLTKYTNSEHSAFYFDIIWANGESALDYEIEIDKKSALSLIEALTAFIQESEN